MRKIFAAFLAFFAFAFIVKAEIPVLNVHDIMQISADSLNVGSQRSTYQGQTVYVLGVVDIPTVVDLAKGNGRPIMYAGARWMVFLRDTNFALNQNSGVCIVQNDTTSAAAQNTNMKQLQRGTVVKVKVKVTNYPADSPIGATQLDVQTDEAIEVIEDNLRTNFPAEPKVALSEFYTAATPNFLTGAKYAGMKVEMNNLTVLTNTPSIIFVDQAGNQIYMRDGQSAYYTTFDVVGTFNKVKDLPPGIVVSKLVGYITSNKVNGVTIPFMIVPALPGDLVVDPNSMPPSLKIQNVRTSAFPKSIDNVPFNLIATKGAADIDSVNIYYKTNIDNTLKVIPATKVIDSLYSVSIPATTADEYVVSYYAKVVDKTAKSARVPVQGYNYYRAMNRNPKIKDIRENFYGNGGTAYVGYPIEIEGVVTMDLMDQNAANTSPRVYIQDDTVAYSGIYLNGVKNGKVRNFRRGDNVKVSGVIKDTLYLSFIDINVANDDLAVKTTETKTIAPKKLDSTKYFYNNNYTLAEPWESMLLQFDNITVVDTNADGTANYGEFTVVNDFMYGQSKQSSSILRILTNGTGYVGGNTSLGTGSTQTIGKTVLPKGTTIKSVVGIMFYDHSNYKLTPRNNEDLTDILDVEVETVNNSNIEVYPNPSSSLINAKVNIEKAGNAIISIIDITGREVISQSFEAIEGLNNLPVNIESLNNGSYILQIKSGTKVESHKISVVK